MSGVKISKETIMPYDIVDTKASGRLLIACILHRASDKRWIALCVVNDESASIIQQPLSEIIGCVSTVQHIEVKDRDQIEKNIRVAL